MIMRDSQVVARSIYGITCAYLRASSRRRVRPDRRSAKPAL